MGNLWKASARGWGWAVESESSQRSGGGGSAREQGAGGVRETGEERARSGISTIGGKQDGNSKRQAFVNCLCLSSSQRNEPNNNRPSPPPNYEIRTVPGLQTSFLFLSFVGSLAVSVFIVVFFFLLLPLPFLSVKGIF